jgi:membrane protease YdiL (CAAX protease family)
MPPSASASAWPPRRCRSVVAVATGAFVPVATLSGGDLGLLIGLGLLVLAMVLVATWEELLLRGVLVGELFVALHRRVPPRLAAGAAVTIAAMLFGLGHAGQPDRPALLAPGSSLGSSSGPCTCSTGAWRW